MRILIASPNVLPAYAYGGTERVIVSLAISLSDIGHKVSILAPIGTTVFDNRVNIIIKNSQISWSDAVNSVKDIDVVHFNTTLDGVINKPYIITQHGNASYGELLDYNTVFVSQNHALRYNSTSYVHNGLDWREYGKPNLDNKRNYFHFLGKAAWRVKNVQGAIDIARGAGEKLVVAGGNRLNIKMGFRFTPWLSIKFAGMVGGTTKNSILQNSKGLMFPVKWHEPFGLAITESLYFGCPVFGTPYGSLPELIGNDYGFLSNSQSELIEAVKQSSKYDRKELHNYALTQFDSKTMAVRYIEYYQRVLYSERLNIVQPSLVEPTAKFLSFNK